MNYRSIGGMAVGVTVVLLILFALALFDGLIGQVR